MNRLTPRKLRLMLLAGGFLVIGLIATLALTALEDNLVYFRSPADLAVNGVTSGETIRVGGLVAGGSLARDGIVNRFIITDGENNISVRYEGLLPDLFRERQGVVAEGAFGAGDEGGLFIAQSVLAKHDENYMPPEVAEALKQQKMQAIRTPVK